MFKPLTVNNTSVDFLSFVFVIIIFEKPMISSLKYAIYLKFSKVAFVN